MRRDGKASCPVNNGGRDRPVNATLRVQMRLLDIETEKDVSLCDGFYADRRQYQFIDRVGRDVLRDVVFNMKILGGLFAGHD